MLFSQPRHRLVIAAILALLPLFYFYPAVLGQVLLAPGDGWTQILGLRVLIGQMIAQGQLPLWNPYIFAGMPLLASIQVGALYPFTWLFAVLPAGIAMNAMVISTYHIALIGMYLYARFIGANRTGALVSAISFTFGGFMLTHMGHTNRTAAAAWLPWIILAVAQLQARFQWHWVVLGALFVALQLFAGDPQMTLYTAMLSGGYWLFLLFAPSDSKRRLRFLIATGAMAVCGALLSAIALLPEWEMLKQGERAQIPYEYFSLFSLPPHQLFTLIVPYFFGGNPLWPYRVVYWGPGDLTETASYVGLLALLLVFVALGNLRRQRIVVFWAVAAMLSLALAFGSYLPFGLHRWLYAIPVYNLFRSSGRHVLEFTFALSVLAGLGLTYLAKMEWTRARRILVVSSGALAILFGIAATAYLFFGARLHQGGAPPSNAAFLANFELLFPLIFFLLGLVSVWVYAAQRSAFASGLLLVVLILDLGAFGFFYEWRRYPYDLTKRVNDPAAVQYIKAREPNVELFRVANHTAWPQSHGASMLEDSYNNLNYPNVSILRGLQMVNGYDPVRLLRMTDISGAMALDGMIEDSTVLGTSHQGFNLLNVKYLLQEKRGAVEPGRGVTYDRIRFSEAVTNIKLNKPGRIELLHAKATATELAIISSLANSVQIAQGTPLAQIKLFTTDGKVIERELQAGRDTSEWAWDRPDVKAVAQHQRANIAESYPADGFEAHRYIARLPFDRAEIERIEITSLLQKAELLISRATLYDATQDVSVQVDGEALSPDRWRKLETFGQVEVYENLKQMSRAWFVNKLSVQTTADALRIIQEGKFGDGTPFDPAQTAILEVEDFGGREALLPPLGAVANSTVAVTNYQPQHIEIDATSQDASFLVLSEIYYRGWEARIDGTKAPIYRVNHTLRGLSVPSGKHKIEFVYRPSSFRTGALYSLLGVLLLSVGAFTTRKLKLEEAPLLVTDETEEKVEPSTPLNLHELIPPRMRELFSPVLLWANRIITARNILILLLIGYAVLMLRNAAYAVAGSDATGYINTARAILQGNVVESVAAFRALELPDSFGDLFRPLGYVPGSKPGTIIPFYPIGMSLHMLAAAVVAGWKNGPFLISPLAAILSVWLLYLLGIELGLSRWFALAGSLILAICPVFIFIGLLPMSDVLATFWAILTIYAALRSRRDQYWALAAGAAFGIAFLVRPNNVFLLLPLLFCFRLKPKVLALFVLGGVPLALGFFAFNRTAYGSILQTGYGAIELYRVVKLSNSAINFKNYLSWLAMGLSPLILLGWLVSVIEPKIEWRVRGLILSWFGVFFLFYCFYEPYHAWWFSRFLLPGIPAIILGTLLVLQHAGERLAQKLATSVPLVQGVAVAILLAIVFGFAVQNIQREYVLNIGIDQYVHSRSCRWADEQLPERTLIVAMEMSGALKYYTNRSMLRYDFVRPDQWQTLTKRAAEKGYRWYALLMPHEIAEAQKQVTGKWAKVGDYGQISLWQIEPVS
ncbi:MAG: YfhO family protein [Acidobacteria bacterium]|nr:YfhO family protein [Acidobacteriota bacterium]